MKSMKKLKVLHKIAFIDILEKNSHSEITNLWNKIEEVFSKTLKIHIISVLSFSVSLFSAYNWVVFPFISLSIILLNLFYYLRSDQYLKKVAYNFAVFINVQTALVFILQV